jgi:hypothetical protein
LRNKILENHPELEFWTHSAAPPRACELLWGGVAQYCHTSFERMDTRKILIIHPTRLSLNNTV